MRDKGNWNIQRHMKYQLIFMWLYVFALYLPFCILMVHRHDVGHISISVIGWFSGGLQYLIAYLALTLPFCLYQLFFLNRHFAGNHKWVYMASSMSCALMTIGGFIPLRREEQYLLVNTIHEFVSVGSTIVFMSIILAVLILCAGKSRRKLLFYVLCGIFPLGLLVGFLILWTAALFQLLATLSFLLVLLCVNTVFVRRPAP